MDHWKQYVTDSLIETVLARDVLQLQRVTKPALLRHLFLLSAAYPAQILSYTKMLGQLHDAGNTTTLSHYLTLLESAFLVSGLPAFSRGWVRRRASSPKLVLWNNALISALAAPTFEQACSDAGAWGRLVENAVGAHLLNGLPPSAYSVNYWRMAGEEVDFVVQRGTAIWAVEVKSGRGRKVSGLRRFCRRTPTVVLSWWERKACRWRRSSRPRHRRCSMSDRPGTVRSGNLGGLSELVVRTIRKR